ncbi:MAG: SGNH/GDSL hydrolase family protein, partial [Clostridiaceae bacterium]|nr:SGNH/GDSL hydrolase family protein [Clostridiaceae bacterium]
MLRINMNWENELFNKNEKPLDKFVDGYSNTSVFRTIAFIGDSLSSGELETRDENNKPGYHDLFDYSWGQYIARKNGLKAYNFSRGGMTAKEYIESFAEQNNYWDKEKACQAYVLALGVNDIYNRNMEIGTIDDIDKNDYRKNKHTFAGYYGAIISRYKEISPDAKFFFVTFPNSNTPNRDDKTLGMINLLYAISD